MIEKSNFKDFEMRARDLVAHHPVVCRNPYTVSFAERVPGRQEVRDLTVQFSVFSHIFIEAQLLKCINAGDITSYRKAKEILMNELGVVFGPTGSVEGSCFTFRAAHFEWLLRCAEAQGLTFAEVGKRSVAWPSTNHFCDALLELYGSTDISVAAGASFAIEHWAAAGFWKELICGLTAFKKSQCPQLPLSFWKFHDMLEDQHAEHTDEELSELMHLSDFDSERFLFGAESLLDAVYDFWNGLATALPLSATEVKQPKVLTTSSRMPA